MSNCRSPGGGRGVDMQMEYPISDLARIFPDMTPEDFARLVSSIREDGLMDPITVWQG